MADHDPVSGHASIVDELAESEAFAGVAPDLITDAVRHYADTAPLDQADDLADFLVSESEIGPLEDLVAEDGPFEGLDHAEFTEPLDNTTLLAPSDSGYHDLGEADESNEFGHETTDDLDTDADDPILGGDDIDTFEDTSQVFDEFEEQAREPQEVDSSFEDQGTEDFESDEFETGVEDDTPDFDPDDIDF